MKDALSLSPNKLMRCSFALRKAYTPTSKELSLARQMSRQESSLNEIHSVLAWPCCIGTTRNRLKKYNIVPFCKRAHRGVENISYGARP